MKTLFFDTETTGLIPKGIDYKTGFNQFPHIVQIAWKSNGRLTSHIIKPEGYNIPVFSTKIHRISHDEAMEKGVDFGYAMRHFIACVLCAERIVAHNIYFDTSVIKANILRRGLIRNFENINEALHKSKRIDTASKAIKLCGLKQKGGKRPKIPTLLELHVKLFGVGFEAHNAANDVEALERCYEVMKILGAIRQ